MCYLKSPHSAYPTVTSQNRQNIFIKLNNWKENDD